MRVTSLQELIDALTMLKMDGVDLEEAPINIVNDDGEVWGAVELAITNKEGSGPLLELCI
jgi:hypothetical protein